MRKIFPIKSKKFGDRLKTLMICNGLSSLDLAVKLLGYSEKPKSNTDEYKECRVKERTIKNHLKLGALDNQNSSESLSTLYLIEYCNFFHCESDFLLGYIDFPTRKVESVYEVTGLSDTAIDTLNSLKNTYDFKHTMDIFNFIMSDTHLFGAFLSCLRDYIEPGFTIPLHPERDKNTKNISYVENLDVESDSILINKDRCVYIGKKNGELNGKPLYDPKSIPVSELSTLNLLQIQEILLTWKNQFEEKE